MENKTRKQLIKEEKYNLIKRAADGGFYLYEIAGMFKMTEGRICQILKSIKSADRSNSRNKL